MIPIALPCEMLIKLSITSNTKTSLRNSRSTFTNSISAVMTNTQNINVHFNHQPTNNDHGNVHSTSSMSVESDEISEHIGANNLHQDHISMLSSSLPSSSNGSSSGSLMASHSPSASNNNYRPGSYTRQDVQRALNDLSLGDVSLDGHGGRHRRQPESRKDDHPNEHQWPWAAIE